MRGKFRQFLFLILIAGFLLMDAARYIPVDGAFQTWLEANAPRQTSPARLLLVELSDEELAAGSPMEASLFVNAALGFEPRVVAIESVPDLQTEQIPLLRHQLLRAPKGLLGATFGFLEDPLFWPPVQEVPVLRHVAGGDASRVPEFPVIAAQPPEDLRGAAALGFFAPTDGARTVRRVPLVFRYRGFVVPSFALRAAMLWHGVTPEEVTVAPGSHIALGKLRIPVDAAGTMAVDFAAPVTRLSAGDLILAAEVGTPVDVLKDGFALLARTDAQSRTLPLANGRNGSRGELTAAAIATLQAGRFATRAGWPVEAALIAGAGLLGWLCRRRKKTGAIVLCTGVFAVYLLAALAIFAQCGLVLPFLLPAGLLLFLILFHATD